jgi:hypothetical protein
MTEQAVREDFAARLIARFERMGGLKAESAIRVVRLTLEDLNEPEAPVRAEEEDDE